MSRFHNSDINVTLIKAVSSVTIVTNAFWFLLMLALIRKM